MSDKIDVTFGWVTLRDPRTVKDRERKAILAAAMDLSDEDLQTMLDRSKGASMAEAHDFENVFVSTMVGEWSFDEPVSSEGLAELPWVTRNEITELVAPKFRELFPSFEPDPEPDSPTVPSGA
jgi:hypothetical protein